METQEERTKRNLNACKEAIVARVLYNECYAYSGSGQQDFYDNLNDNQKDTCREIVDEILKSDWRDE